MTQSFAEPTSRTQSRGRRVVHITPARTIGGILRMMSPGDLGELLKPFVFLDLFDMDGEAMGNMPLHPHSGIATVTVLTEGDLRFDEPGSGSGTIAYGAVEWMRGGGGVWHGKELSRGTSAHVRGFQLWLALPPELENGPVEVAYIEATGIPRVSPATVILGELDGVHSPVNAPRGINYLLVTLAANQAWTYDPPEGHTAAFAAVASGTLDVGRVLRAGEMCVFEQSGPIHFKAGSEKTAFVVGSAVPHRHDLVTGYYSVHTSEAALKRGEDRIAELGALLPRDGSARQTSVPIFKG